MSGSDLPSMIGGRYRPLRVIGRGGMGVVFEVEHIHTGERLALKLLSAQSHASGESVNRFKREARASAQIKSEHVVRVTDADAAEDLDGAPFLVMDLLEGADLEKTAGAQRQPPAVVLEWLRQVARGLNRAHRLGLVHRDLKPENLFLTHREDGSPLIKILDFGIVKNMGQVGTTTGNGQLLGTPLYMSPEQAYGGEVPITPAADLYSLGLIAFRLLTGLVYRRGENLIQVIHDITSTAVVAPSLRGSDLGPEFDTWFGKACHPNPLMRFANAGEQIEALAVALGLPAHTLESSADRRFSSAPAAFPSAMEVAPTLAASASSIAEKRPPNRRPIVAGAVLAMLAVGGLAVFVLRARPAPRMDDQPTATTGQSPPPLPATPLSASAVATASSEPAVSSAPAKTDAPPTRTARPARETTTPPHKPPGSKTTPGPVPPDPLADQK